MRSLAVLALLAAGSALPAGPARLLPYDEKVHAAVVSGHKGSVVLIDSWATWCAPCLAELPQLVTLEAKLREKGFRLVSVSADDPSDEAAALQFLQKHNVSPPAYLKRVADDDKFIGFIDPKWSGALPALFLYDRNGRLARSFVGETEISVIEKAVRSLL